MPRASVWLYPRNKMEQTVLDLFLSIRPGSVGRDKHAIHKPILLLMVLQDTAEGHANSFTFSEYDQRLKRALDKYSEPTAFRTRHEPFWRLKNDNIWKLEGPSEVINLSEPPALSIISEENICAKMSEEVHSQLFNSPELCLRVSESLVEKFVPKDVRDFILWDLAPTVRKLGRQYWWVSQNKTYKEEISGNFMWSPRRGKGDRSIHSYDLMPQIKMGDLVFSFAGSQIKALGIVNRPAEPSPKPDLGPSGAQWGNDGWLVEGIAYWQLEKKSFKPADYMKIIGPLLPLKYSPLRSDGKGNEMYLARLSRDLAETLLGLCDSPNEIRGITSTLALGELPVMDDEIQVIQDRQDIAPTQKLQLINARRGQGLFRANLCQIEHQCRVTGLDDPQHLIASHIKPWKSSNDQERTDGHNGLLLAPHIDHLFDKGFVSFQDSGQMLVSPKTNPGVFEKWNLPRVINVGSFSSEQKTYLQYHNDVIFQMK